MYAGDTEDNKFMNTVTVTLELVIVDEAQHIINGRPLYIQQGDVFYVRPGDVRIMMSLELLKLINVLILPEVDFHYFTASRFAIADLLFPAGLLLRLAGAECRHIWNWWGKCFRRMASGGKQGAAGSRAPKHGHDHNVCGNRSGIQQYQI